MGIIDSLFGSAPESELTTASTLTDEQKKAEELLSQFISGSGDPNAVTEFEGDLAAPLSNLEEFSLSALEDRAKLLATGGGNELLDTAEQSLIDILTRGPEDISSFIESNISNPLIDIFNEQTRPAISARFADQFFGSNRVEADARATADLNETIFSGTAAAQLSAREFDTNAILTAAGLSTSIGESKNAELQSLLESGSVPRDVQTAQNLSEFEKFQEAKNRELQLSQLINSFLNVSGTENIVTTTEGSSGLLGGALSAGASAAGFAIGGPAGAAAAGLLF